MDADFEQYYQAVERAYGFGEYDEANALALEFWDRLESASDEHDPSIVLGWLAVVSLLLGHIQLHGLQQPDQAALPYQRVLECEAGATIAVLAEHWLERCRSEHISSEATTTPAKEGSIPDLLKDPFLTKDPYQTKPAPVDVVTAMPWLSSEEVSRATTAPAPTPIPAPAPSPEQTVTPKANSDVEMANQEPEPTTEEPPLDAVELTPQEPAARKLLKASWLRVRLPRDIKSPTDYTEPMGIFESMKGIFGRSVGC